MNITFEKFYRQLVRTGYVTGVAMIIGSLAHAKIAMSFGQFILAAAFLLERVELRKGAEFFSSKPVALRILMAVPVALMLVFQSMIQGFRAFFANKPAMIFASVLLLHVAGLLFTTDFTYALKDLRTKLPLFLLTLFLSTSGAFGKRQLYWLFALFVASVLVRTLINSWNLLYTDYVDIREASRNISHIIVSLLTSYSIFILAFFLFRKRVAHPAVRALCGLLIVWFLVFLVISRSDTGMVVTLVTLFILGLVFLFRGKNRRLKILLPALMGVALVVLSVYLAGVWRDYHRVNPVDFSRLDSLTSRGNPYIHNRESRQTENGNYVYIYIQWDEMREAWNRRSAIPFDSNDLKGQKILNTLTRFLASRGYRKDADAVGKLSDEEVRAVEKGIANVVYLQKFSLRASIYELIWGWEDYRKTGDPTGFSLMQRFEFWKASRGLIRDHWLTGVGTGDMNIAFHDQYEKMHSKLAPSQRWRSHNQFLSIAVGFGIFGLAWFLFALLYPPIRLHKFSDYFFLTFFIISLLAMLPEDLIESQAGVTFFAFFYALHLFGRKETEEV